MHRQYPDIQIDFTAYPQQSQMLSDLINDEIDIAVACRDVLGQIPKLNYEMIAENQVAVIVSHQHHLWGRRLTAHFYVDILRASALTFQLSYANVKLLLLVQAYGI